MLIKNFFLTVLYIVLSIAFQPQTIAGINVNVTPAQTGCSLPSISVTLPKGASHKMAMRCPPRRNIVLYDTIIPGKTDAIVDAELRFVGGGIADVLTNADQGGRNFTFFDGGVMQAIESGVPFRFGPHHGNHAHQGAVNGGDYLVLSEITRSGNVFRLRVWIETAVSREIVKDGSLEFRDAKQAMDIGKSVVQTHFTPLSDIISNYEKQKRDSDAEVAIGAASLDDSITFEPASAALNAGESIEVLIMVKDCDGFFLKGRKLTLAASGGTLDKATIVTDKMGKAKVRYTAGNDKNAGAITAILKHKSPSGHPNQAGSAMNVKIHLTELWLMKVNLREMHSETGHTGIEHGRDYSSFIGTGYFSSTTQGHLSVGGILVRQVRTEADAKNLNLYAPGQLYGKPNGDFQWGTFSFNGFGMEDNGGSDVKRSETSLKGDVNSMYDNSLANEGIQSKEQYLGFQFINTRGVLHLSAHWPYLILQNKKTAGLWPGGTYSNNPGMSMLTNQLPLMEFQEIKNGYYMVFQKKVSKDRSKADIEAVVTLKRLSDGCPKPQEEKPEVLKMREKLNSMQKSAQEQQKYKKGQADLEKDLGM